MTSISASNHRLSPIHVFGFLGFVLSLIVYIGARYLESNGSAIEAHLGLLVVVAMSMLVLFLDLWAHDEDKCYNDALLNAPRFTRVCDFSYRLVAYGFLTGLIVKNISYGIKKREEMSFLSNDAVIMAVLLAFAVAWLWGISSHRGAIALKTQTITSKSWKFLFPYYCLLFCGLLAYGFPLLIEKTVIVEVYNLLGSIKQRLVGSGLPDPEMVGVVPGMRVSGLMVLVLIACGTFITRWDYWRSTIVSERRF